MFKLVLEKAEEPEIKLPTSAGSSKKQESSRKTTWEAHFPHYYSFSILSIVLSYIQYVFRSTVSIFPSLESLPTSPSFHIICLNFLFKPIYLFYISVLILYTWLPEKLHVVE